MQSILNRMLVILALIYINKHSIVYNINNLYIYIYKYAQKHFVFNTITQYTYKDEYKI